MSDEEALRQQIVAAARSWIGTPYISNAMIKGPRGGVDCAMILVAVYQEVGLVPKSFDPRPYPAQWHLHRNEERYMRHVLTFMKEVAAPPERVPKAGDIVMFLLGRVFAHAGIVTAWPNIIHAMGGSCVVPADVSLHTTGKRALANMPQMFFSFW